jgi:hypothetical protein
MSEQVLVGKHYCPVCEGDFQFYAPDVVHTRNVTCECCETEFPECEYCAGPWFDDHQCYGTYAEAKEANMWEENYRGKDNALP